MSAMWAQIKKHKNWIIVLVVMIVAGTAGMMFYKKNTTQTAAPVQTARVERGDIASTVSATGTIKPVNIVDISSKITGQIREMKVGENDKVTAGQVLVVLDAQQLEAQVTQARERMANAAAKYERSSRLAKIGAVSDQELDNSRMDYNVAQATFEQANTQLAEAVIKSPIDGVVVGKPIPAGQTVAQGISNPMVILTVADMSKMQIEALVDETDIGSIAVGQKATFTVDAYQGKKFSGKVSNISQKATLQQNVVYYTVIIDVDSPENLLKPTMTARVTINTGEKQNTLLIPPAALKSDKNGQYVVLLKGKGQTENVPVTTGLMSDERIEILSGVNEGDQIVTSQAKAQTATKTGNAGIPGVPGMRGR